MVLTDRTPSSGQLAAYLSTVTGVSLFALSICWYLVYCGLYAKKLFYTAPLPQMQNHRLLWLQKGLEHRNWHANWHRCVFFSDESHFNLSYHDSPIYVRWNASERYFLELIFKCHSGRTPRVMSWDAIVYHKWSQLLKIVDNLNRNRYISEVLEPYVFPYLQAIPETIFQQDNACPHVERNVQDISRTQSFLCSLHISWICCLLNMWGILLVGILLMILILQLPQMNFRYKYKQ